MGNIVGSLVTGVFIYVTDMILQQFKLVGGFMEIIKFFLQGALVYVFVLEIENFSSKSN